MTRVWFVGLLLLTACTVVQPTPFPTPADTAIGRWEQDIEYLRLNFQRLHAGPWEESVRTKWNAELDGLKRDLPQLDNATIRLELWRIMNLFRNNHVLIQVDFGQYPSLPLHLGWFKDGYYVVAATQAQQDLIGHKLLALDGKPIAQVIEAIQPYTNYENQYGSYFATARVLRNLGVLERVGMVASSAVVELSTLSPSGKNNLRTVRPRVPQDVWIDPITQTPDPPLYRQNPGRNYWFARQGPMAYFKYNLCVEQDDIRSYLQNFLTLTHQSEIQQVVIDLRDNPGGRSGLLAPLIAALDNHPITKKRQLYVLTNRGTASSGFVNMLELRQIGAIHVGEASAQRPYSSGNVTNFVLPNSRLNVQYGTKIVNLGAPDLEAIEPDTPITPSANEYFGLDDPVLEWVKQQSARP